MLKIALLIQSEFQISVIIISNVKSKSSFSDENVCCRDTQLRRLAEMPEVVSNHNTHCILNNVFRLSLL